MNKFFKFNQQNCINTLNVFRGKNYVVHAKSLTPWGPPMIKAYKFLNKHSYVAQCFKISVPQFFSVNKSKIRMNEGILSHTLSQQIDNTNNLTLWINYMFIMVVNPTCAQSFVGKANFLDGRIAQDMHGVWECW